MFCRFKKVIFDRMDKKILKEKMKEIGVTEKLRERIMETYKEVKNKNRRKMCRHILDKVRSQTSMSTKSSFIQYGGFRGGNDKKIDRRSDGRKI